MFQPNSPTHALASESVIMLTSITMHNMSIISDNMFNTMANSTLIISTVTNLLATLLIAYKLWLVNILSVVNDDCLDVAGTTEKPLAILV